MAHTCISIPTIVLILLCGIKNFLYAEGRGEIEILTNQQINLTCLLNSTGGVKWYYKAGSGFDDFFTCNVDSSQCDPSIVTGMPLYVLYEDLSLSATRNFNTSVFSITPPTEVRHEIECRMGQLVIKKFTVKPIEKNKVAPNCTVDIPGLNRHGIGSLILLCEVYSGDLNVSLKLEGIANHSAVSSQNIASKVIYFDNNFQNIDNAYCDAYFPDINITPSCRFPRIIQAENIKAGNDIIVNRYTDNESDVGSWKLYDLDGKEEDIEKRSWIRDGGHSLLIRNVSEQDVGKNVIYRTNGTIWFIEIPKISGGESGDNSNTNDYTSTSGDQHNIYLVLTLLFLNLWVVTAIVGGVFLWVKTKQRMTDTTVSSPSTLGFTSNGRSNEHETHLSSVGTRGRRDPDNTNTNNSARNPAFEPETINTNENRGNRQGNDGNHLYFTLEKSSPSPKASTSRQECPGSSLNHPKSSHWPGYETVGDPKKGVFCSFDVGEYADVSFQGIVTSDLSDYSEVDSTQFRGTAPPGDGEYSEVRRSFRGKEQPTLPDRTSLNKIPEREQVERDEISRLYGKVKK